MFELESVVVQVELYRELSFIREYLMVGKKIFALLLVFDRTQLFLPL